MTYKLSSHNKNIEWVKICKRASTDDDDVAKLRGC